MRLGFPYRQPQVRLIPAKAGIQGGRSRSDSRILDSGFRRNDEFGADMMEC